MAGDELSTAEVALAAAPHAGAYRLRDEEGCILAPPARGKPVSFTAVMTSPNALLSVEIPDIAHLDQLMVSLTVATPEASSRRDAASEEYALDTRPADALTVYERTERGRLGVRGRGKATLVDRGTMLTLTFSGQTAQGARIEGTLRCLTVDREFGR